MLSCIFLLSTGPLARSGSMADNLQPPKSGASSGLSRRGFLKGVGAAAVVADGLLNRVSQAAPSAEADAVGSDNGIIAGNVKITLKVNGEERPIMVEPRTTLLSAMRDRLDPPIT